MARYSSRFMREITRNVTGVKVWEKTARNVTAANVWER
jgi:hypothetical protein